MVVYISIVFRLRPTNLTNVQNEGTSFKSNIITQNEL